MRHRLLFFVLFGMLSPAVVWAQNDVTSQIISRLNTEGFQVSETRRTWLGRILIVSKNGNTLREVVINRKTGEIINDQLFQDQGMLKSKDRPTVNSTGMSGEAGRSMGGENSDGMGGDSGGGMGGEGGGMGGEGGSGGGMGGG